MHLTIDLLVESGGEGIGFLLGPLLGVRSPHFSLTLPESCAHLPFRESQFIVVLLVGVGNGMCSDGPQNLHGRFMGIDLAFVRKCGEAAFPFESGDVIVAFHVMQRRNVLKVAAEGAQSQPLALDLRPLTKAEMT
jgi:hypothetical protein